MQESRASVPNDQLVQWNGGFNFEAPQQGELTPPSSPNSEPVSPMTIAANGAPPATITSLDLVVRPKTPSSPPKCSAATAPPKQIDVMSPEGQRRIASLKRHFGISVDEPASRLYAFFVTHGVEIEHNWVRIRKESSGKKSSDKVDSSKESSSKESCWDDSAAVARSPETYLYVAHSEPAWAANSAMVDQFYSLLWAAFLDSENDVQRPRLVRRATSSNDEDWVSASRIRKLQAVPKHSPLALPAAVARHIPKTRSPLSIVTVIVEEHEMHDALETADRFHRYICVADAAQRCVLDDDYDSAGDLSFTSDSSTWTASFDSDSSAWSSVATADACGSAANGPVSYHSARGTELLRAIQAYLARPAGEAPHETSGWIDHNRGTMQEIRLGRIAVALPGCVQAQIADGQVAEEEAQGLARRALKDAIAMVDWDEIDDEPVC